MYVNFKSCYMNTIAAVPTSHTTVKRFKLPFFFFFLLVLHELKLFNNTNHIGMNIGVNFFF